MQQAASETPAEFSEDLKGVFETLWSRRTAFFLGFAPVVLAAAGYLHFAIPQYTANATLVLDPRKQVVTTSPEVLPDADPNSSMVDTQVELIRSRAVLGRAVDKLGNIAERAVKVSPSFSHGMLTRIGLDQQSVSTTPARTREQLIDQLNQNLDVVRTGLTFAIQIRHTSESPRYSADVANSVALAYRDYQTELKQQATKDATSWLSEQVTELRERVAAAEAAVDRYRSLSGLLTAGGATSTEVQVTGLDVGANEAQQQLTEARAKLENYQNAFKTTGASEAAKIAATPTMQMLRTQYMSLVNQQAQISQTLGPSHPQMRELRRQFDALQKEIDAEANRTTAELSSDVAVAERRVEGLLAIRDKSRAQLAQDNAATVELTQLQASAQSLRTLYEEMLARLQQTSAQESRSQINATIVSSALPPNAPSSPRLNVVLPTALAVGMAFGALAVMLVQLIDSTVVNPRDLERKTRVPILALIPRLSRRDLRVNGKRISITELLHRKPLSLFAESFRNLRVALQSVGRTDGLILQITSGTFAEGKTVSSMAFAQAAAMDGRRVLLVDADVRRRALTHRLGIKVEKGLIELLRRQATLDEVLIPQAESEQLYVLPLSVNDADSHDYFSGQSFDKLLQQLRSEFDLVVIDSAPVLVVAESLALANHVDAVVVAVRWSSTSLQTVAKAIEAILRANGYVAGLLLTQVSMKKVTNLVYGKQHYPALMKYYQQ